MNTYCLSCGRDTKIIDSNIIKIIKKCNKCNKKIIEK